METRQRFSKNFKLEAVRLLELGLKPAAQLGAQARGSAQSALQVESTTCRQEGGGVSRAGPKQEDELARFNESHRRTRHPKKAAADFGGTTES
jgi:hypothetical protein